ncbi:N-acetylmuramoyl-L-alanine amidase, family 3 [Pseudooceanicola batsensis HTCC2597]|uniref:N-acetylmuramoyl-L-alanine amidase n=2 Tax=Pseudooceanicola batsensis TaxID=314255 RepID=A3U2F9_PSEBH|nr:N-acetylmuramoyl-L-alanine amidase, family 3 [Pseudooceanicola batsensis HTCC2597]
MAAMTLGAAGGTLAQGLSALARVAPGGTAITDEGRGIRVELALSQGVPWRMFALADPERLVIDLREVDWTGLDRDEALRSDRVTDLRFGTYRPGWSRMVLTLAEPLALDRSAMRIDPDTGRATMIARFVPTDAAGFAATAGAPRDPQWDLPEPGLPPAPAGDDGVLTVVIDPGHGGVDPGAVRGELMEKTLMLDLAQALREALIRQGDTRVVLTRSDDVFVPLERRVSIAHEVRADLFISLHADVLPYGRAHGATFYTLADTASDEASAKLAERHDRDDLLSGVDLTGKDDVVAGVLMDLARQETAPRARALSRALQQAVKAAEVPLNSRPHRAADFSVLKAADIPSVLIEVGYLSSERDRRNLSDPAFLPRIADAIRDGILTWQAEDAALQPLVRQ